MRRIAASVLVLHSAAVFGCDRLLGSTDPEPPEPPAAPSPTPTAANTEGSTPSPDPDQPCIVGRWKANDFIEAIRGDMGENAELRDVELTRESGAITFHLGPIRHEAGELTVTANDLAHRAEARVRGIQGSATHRLHGGSRMPYRLPAEGRMRVETPAEGELASRVTVSTNVGFQFDRDTATPIRFAGDYDYECEGRRLIVRRLENDRPSNPVRFQRITEEEYATLSAGVGITERPPDAPSGKANPRGKRSGRGGALRALRRAAEAFRERAAETEN